MGDDVDKSLLNRLQALRGEAATSTQSATQTPKPIEVDVIERKKTPTREDALATRLKSLRDAATSPPASGDAKQTATPPRLPASASHTASQPGTARPDASAKPKEEEVVDSMFETDDNTLEELLADVTPDEEPARPQQEPSDEQVKALLEQLSKEVPKEGVVGSAEGKEDTWDADSDDSDGEEMMRKADEVIDRYRDEAEVEASLRKDSDDAPDNQNIYNNDESEDDNSGNKDTADLDMPSVPSNMGDLPATARTGPKPKTVDDIAARVAALRAPSHDDDGESSLNMPSVPTSRPSGKPVKRLTTRTNYTDDDVDSWCTVCLEDATLRCLGCDDDVYCARCWREMHIGSAAAFDDRTHKAIQFTRDKKKEKPKKVALGA